jgi:hypothetical protein
VFVIDSKLWTGSVHQGAGGLVWHDHYRLDRTLETVRWVADTLGRLLGTRAVALLCVHGAHVHRGGLDVQGVVIVPATGSAARSSMTGCCRTSRWHGWPPPPGPAWARPPDPPRRPCGPARGIRPSRVGAPITNGCGVG